MMWWLTFFKAIDFQPGHQSTLWCDNAQTVRIVNQEESKLNTKLKHVDIHQHWLRQEVQRKKIIVDWLPTAYMPADGLTKMLPRQRHETFVKQLGLRKLTATKVDNKDPSKEQLLYPHYL